MFKFVNKYAITVAVFLIFWLGVLPIFLAKTVNVVCKNLSHNSQYTITVTNPRFRTYVLPCIRFKADNIAIKSKKSIYDCNIDNLNVKFRILPLLTGKLHINRLNVGNLNMQMELKKEARLNKNFFEKLQNTHVLCDSVHIYNYSLQLVSPNIKNPAILDGKDFIFKHNNRYLKLKTDSEFKAEKLSSKIFVNIYLPDNNDINKSIFDVDITNLNIAPFGEYFKYFLPPSLKELKGFIDVDADKSTMKVEARDVSAIMSDKDLSIVLPTKMTLVSNFKISKNAIVLDNADIKSERTHAIVKGSIKNYISKSMPIIDMNIIIDKSRLEDYLNILPPFKVEEFDSYKLKKYKFYADIIGNLSIKGKISEPDLYGDVFIDNGILMRPIPNTTHGATVKLSFAGKYVNYDVLVPAGGSQKVWVKGSQEIYNIKYADLIVKSTQNVDLHVAETYVNPVHEILNFIIGPVPILDVYGTGNIDISVKGNRKNPHVWGSLNFYNAKVNFYDIPDLVMKDADAVLAFNDKNATFKTIGAKLNDKDFKISGICDLDGKFDFNVESFNQPTENLYVAIKTSKMLQNVQKMLPQIDKIVGCTDFTLKIYGAVKDIAEIDINKNTFVKGDILIKNNDINMLGVEVNNASGKLKLDSNSAIADVTATISNSPMKIYAKIKENIADLILNIPKFNPNFLLQDEKLREKQYLPFVSVEAKYKGDINNIEFDKMKLVANVIQSAQASKIVFNSGNFSLRNGKLTVKNLDAYLQSPKNYFKTDLKILNTFTNKPIISGVFNIGAENLNVLNELFKENIFPPTLQNVLKNIEFSNGGLRLNGKIVDNKITTETDLNNISAKYLPLDLPVNILNGNLAVHNNNIIFNKINIIADDMPILIDGELKNFLTKKNFDIYINSKPKQDFIDKYINRNRIYPIKMKGDIVYTARFKGSPENYDLKANMNLSKNSSIYHYGATIGDIENAIVLDIDSHIKDKNNLKIRELSYDKLIDSQNGKATRLNMLKAWGGVTLLENDLGFNDLRIKTANPVDARIFNIIFGKPNIKQGQFSSDLRMNGALSNPRILGNFYIFETNIPFLDTTMKSIEFVFKDRFVNITSKGEVLGNDVSVNATIKNKLTPPYYIEKAELYTKDLDLNRVVSKIKTAEMENLSSADSMPAFDINNVVADNLKLKADRIELRNIHATNFSADTSINSQRVFDIKNFVFNIAQGSLSGKYKYNLKNNDISFNLNANSIDANEITWAIFDLNNQIYGDMTGNVNMSCNGQTFEKCMQTLNGETNFNVKNGRMPKLGSLEYLLKAGNLLKGGLTNVSINSILDIITPMKSGVFSDIYGVISVKNGVAEDIEITTQGENLSLFISGNYNFATSIAEMEVLGMLSRKMSTMFGPIGNISVNTLFNLIPGVDLEKESPLLKNINRIPGIELSSKNFRKFVAEIKGNINGENYVKSFKWIN